MLKWFKRSKNSLEMESTEDNLEIGNDSRVFNQKLIGNILRVIVYLVPISLVFGLAFYVKHELTLIKNMSQVSIEREADILSTLSDLQLKISAIKTNTQQISELKIELDHVQETMVTAQSMSGFAKASELKQLSVQLKSLAKNRSHHQPVKKYHKELIGIETSIPFQVESLDIMAGQPFASVIYHENRVPVMLNESLAGWKAVKLDVVSGIVIWENLHGRRIRMTAARGLYA